VVSVNPVQGPWKAGSIGVPIPGVEISVQDDNGVPVTEGVDGEICVRGGNVMLGYWNAPQKTAETLVNGWLRTGDIGHRLPEGYYVITDRKKDMLKPNGINVYPREIEEVIYRYPGIREAAVVGEPCEKRGERPVAFVNIGGVANMTWIGRDGDLVAFDTGPGNALLNDWCERHTDVPYDRDGMLARRGSSNTDVLGQLLKNNFFATSAPKSLDRNTFQTSVVDALSPADGAATLTRFTAASIALSEKLLPEPPRLYIICGGGRLNPTLIQNLGDLLQASVIIAEDVGMNGDSMEAEAWAYLAVRCLKGLPITFPGTTGVAQPLSGGVVARP
jgi:hypothetical protein